MSDYEKILLKNSKKMVKQANQHLDNAKKFLRFQMK